MVITLRSIPLYIAPIMAFAIIVWIALCMFAPPAGEASQAELVGLLAYASIGVCAYTVGRLSPRRKAPDLRIPFFLNAAGLAVLLGWFALSLLSGLWHNLLQRAA
jgi:hypothetical protein